MRNPDLVLNSLASKSQDENYKFERIYRNLYNPEFFLKAYSKISPKEGNMTKGTDGLTIDGMSLERINNLIETLKDQTYQPKPARREYIDKKNGAKRPLGIPSVDDKLVQEVIRSILESIYGGSFSNLSHGFRPNRSCHTALDMVHKRFIGARWFVEGDIKGFFDNINHQTLINILRKRIEDEKFIQLIWKFLKAGYMEEWTYNKTYSGTPQGGIISPILSNIYLNELDKYIEKYKNTFDKGIERKNNPEYRHLEYQIRKTKLQLQENWDKYDDNTREILQKLIKEYKQKRLNMDYKLPMDSNYKRLYYVRYADDFLIGIIGSKEEAQNIKADLTVFLKEQLDLELSEEKTLITNTKNKARFLGYDIRISRDNSVKKDKNGIAIRSNKLKPQLLVPKEKWIENLKSKGALEINGNQWKPIHRVYLKDNDDLEIISIYNAEISGLYNYYKLALNVSVLNKYKYIMEYSMYKTYASKYKTTIAKIINKYSINGEFGIKYETKEGLKTRFFYNKGFKRQKNIPSKSNEIDVLPRTLVGRTSLIERLLADKCEWCGQTDVPLEIHHVRKLKDLKGKKLWEEVMIQRKRKTMALCHNCHVDLHAGRLD